MPAGREVGDHLVRHPGIDKIAFTGSTIAGRKIAAAASERLARVSLELGGKSAAVILDDAEIGDVLASLVPFSMPITGQVCFSLTRVLVPTGRKSEVLEAYVDAVRSIKVGDPFEAATQMGPLTMARQLDRVQGYIAKGVDQGARIVTGGGRPDDMPRGYFIEPTVFDNVESSMTIAQEEIFGPVVSFIEYDGTDDAVAKANDTIYGLHGAVYSADPERAYEFARRDALGQRHGQRHGRRHQDAVRRLQAVRHGPRGRHRGPRGLLRDQDDLLRLTNRHLGSATWGQTPPGGV